MVQLSEAPEECSKRSTSPAAFSCSVCVQAPPVKRFEADNRGVTELLDAGIFRRTVGEAGKGGFQLTRLTETQAQGAGFDIDRVRLAHFGGVSG